MAEERLSWNLIQVNVGTGSKFGSVYVQSVVPTAPAEQFVLVNKLTSEKLELCPHHIVSLTLHPLLVPFRSALVKLEEKWKQTGIILMETCCAVCFLFFI